MTTITITITIFRVLCVSLTNRTQAPGCAIDGAFTRYSTAAQLGRAWRWNFSGDFLFHPYLSSLPVISFCLVLRNQPSRRRQVAVTTPLTQLISSRPVG